MEDSETPSRYSFPEARIRNREHHGPQLGGRSLVARTRQALERRLHRSPQTHLPTDSVGLACCGSSRQARPYGKSGLKVCQKQIGERSVARALARRRWSSEQTCRSREASERRLSRRPQPAACVGRDSDDEGLQKPAPRMTEPDARRDEERQPSSRWIVRRVLPPPHNEVSPEGMEQLLGSLHATPGVLSLEIAGDSRQRQMLVRGRPAAVSRITHQLQAAYGHVSWEDPGDDDPGLSLSDARPEDGVHVAYRELELRRPVFFPIRTWRAFEDADPLRVFLGAFRGLREDEHLCSQLVLLEPAPDDWADAYQGASKQADFRMEAASPLGQARAALFASGIVVAFADLLVVFFCLGRLFRPDFGVVDGLKMVGGLGVLAAANLAFSTVASRWWRKLSAQLNADPDVVQRKVSLPAYRCALRLWAIGPTIDRAEALVERLTSAYGLYNSAEGNSFRPKHAETPRGSVSVSEIDGPGGNGERGDNGAPNLLPAALPNPSGDISPLAVLKRILGGDQGLTLNVAELAGLWHMPLGASLEMVRREEHERFVPLPDDVADPHGVRVGQSVKDDQTTVDVSLSQDAIGRNTVMIGKTQMGKSNLMEILAHHAMEKPDSAVVVLDPQGDMARHLCGMMPPDRAHQTYYLDFADRQRIVGLNLLDMALGIEVDKVVSDLIGLGEALWSRFWGPRMEAAWRYATKSLALINQHLVAQGREEEQYTLLDVPPLLLAPKRARRDFLMHMLPWDSAEGRDAHWWWNTYYEQLRKSLQQDVISPVLTKVFRVAGNDTSRMVFGQSVSTLDVRRVLGEGGILLVHTAHGELGEEIGGFVGAVFLNLLNIVFRERAAQARADRLPCLAIIDEFQTIPAVDYGALLSELQKFEVAFVLGTQSLARLRAIDRELPGVTFGGIATTVAFQTNHEDARYLSGELDGIDPSNLVNLEPYDAYVKTTDGEGHRLPVYSLSTTEAPSPDRGLTTKVLERVSGYTRLAADAGQRTGKLADELGGGAEARERAAQLRNRLRSDEEQVVSKKELVKLARMTATASTQTFRGQAGNVARGQSSENPHRVERE